jgi:hypothetical protein
MQRSDFEFIEKYKQKQSEMRQSVHQVVIKVDAQVDVPVKDVPVDVPVKDVPVDVPVENVPVDVPVENVPVDAKENTKKDYKNLTIVTKTNDEKQNDALQLIKNALEQINFALSLLQEVKNEQISKNLPTILEEDDSKLLETISIKKLSETVSVSEQKLSETIAVSEQKLSETIAVSEQKLSETVSVSEQKLSEKIAVSEQKLSETVSVSEQKLSETIAVSEQKLSETIAVSEKKLVKPVNIDHISDIEEDEITSQRNKENFEEFKIFIPKSSRKKKLLTNTTNSFPEKQKYPSVSSSFTPIKKIGSWSVAEGKKSLLEISREIAHIPSPTPCSSPSPNLRAPSRLSKKDRCGYASRNEDSDEEPSYSDNEYQIRKKGDYFD